MLVDKIYIYIHQNEVNMHQTEEKLIRKSEEGATEENSEVPSDLRLVKSLAT